MRVLSIFGTRPEAIKLGPLIKKMEEQPEEFSSSVCVTSQHREMLSPMLEVFGIAPDYDLDIMRENQSLHDITSAALKGIRGVIEKSRPDLVLVQGDTTTTFTGSLAAFYAKIPVAHVEAGLRTNDKYRPFPEEINRKLVSHIADCHFAPTERARDNLLKEGIEPEKVFVTGNTVIDALMVTAEKVSAPDTREKWRRHFIDTGGISFPDDRKTILVTAHRRESYGRDLEGICRALKEIVSFHDDADIVFPVHPNPNIREPVTKMLGAIPRIHLLPPLDYEPFVYLMSRSFLVLTDSGGIQEEAPSLGLPVLIMRECTERPEAIEAGTARLAGTSPEAIAREVATLLTDERAYRKMSGAHNPFGDGKASGRILRILRAWHRPQ